MDTERRQFERERSQANSEVKQLSTQLSSPDNSYALGRLADLNGRLTQAEQRLDKIRAQRDEIKTTILLTLSVVGLKGVNACLAEALEIYDR